MSLPHPISPVPVPVPRPVPVLRLTGATGPNARRLAGLMTDMSGDAAARRSRLEARIRDARQLEATLDLERAAMVEASAASNADDEHDPEGATIAFERAQLDATITEVRRQRVELDAAVVRLDDGTYGICVVCGLPIPTERLDARPSATTHVACAP